MNKKEVKQIKQVKNVGAKTIIPAERINKYRPKGDCPKCGGVHFNCFCCIDPNNCPIHRREIINIEKENYEWLMKK